MKYFLVPAAVIVALAGIITAVTAALRRRNIYK